MRLDLSETEFKDLGSSFEAVTAQLAARSANLADLQLRPADQRGVQPDRAEPGALADALPLLPT